MIIVSFPYDQQQPSPSHVLRACLAGRDWFEEHMAFVIKTASVDSGGSQAQRGMRVWPS